MTRSEIIRATIAGASRQPLERVQDGARLTEDLGLRSLARVELAVALEDRLATPVTDELVMRASTVGDLERALGA
ncbi:MAG TPA: acyl carrier protein [Kofleriaceae bacterium]|nr:acyl carrier protein [Kofleriaceae bacterium]